MSLVFSIIIASFASVASTGFGYGQGWSVPVLLLTYILIGTVTFLFTVFMDKLIKEQNQW